MCRRRHDCRNTVVTAYFLHICRNVLLGNVQKSDGEKSKKKVQEKIQDIRVSEKSEFSTWPLQDCFFKVQCKMNSDASNHELIEIDDKESIRCHILKCFEISWVH